MIKTNTLHQWDTKYTADCLEFCPIKGHESLLAVGTYQFQSDTGQRIGNFSLLNIEVDSVVQLEEHARCGILDLKWSVQKIGDEIVLGCVTSNGLLELYTLVNNRLHLWHSSKVSDWLALYLDFSNRRSNADLKVAVSDSSGVISVTKLGGHFETTSFKAHIMEAWVTVFNCYNSNILYTGSDDGVFKSFDLRDTKDSAFRNRSHESGITSIVSLPFNEHLVLTGSYDENIRIFDVRKVKEPIKTIYLGGGVWRIKLHPTNQHRLVTACMREGSKLLEFTPNFDDIKFKHAYNTKHHSLAYGVDWSWKTETNMLASVSFYDHLMCVWTVENYK